jgi:hypothetical protein
MQRAENEKNIAAKSASRAEESDNWQNVDGNGSVSNEHITRIQDDYMMSSKQTDRIEMPWTLQGEKVL